MKKLIATALAAGLALAGMAMADDTHKHDAPAPQKKAAAKPAAKRVQHGHDACPMMQDGMMGKGGMGMMGGTGVHDPAAHAAIEKRLEHMEKRLDMMQTMMEQMMRRQEGQVPMPAK
jgi:hypothetical protein